MPYVMAQCLLVGSTNWRKVTLRWGKIRDVRLFHTHKSHINLFATAVFREIRKGQERKDDESEPETHRDRRMSCALQHVILDITLAQTAFESSFT